MDELSVNILNGSNKLLAKLQLLSVFFDDEKIYKIFLRSQVIHKLFENNPDLDINKLDLFHLQYTASLIDLLRKIKKANERNAQVLLDEVALNEELIVKLNDSVYTENTFANDQKRQALKVKLSLQNLYRVLSEESTEYPFSRNINSFSLRFAPDFYYDLPQSVLQQLITYDTDDVYVHEYATIHKKLMGQLCKHEFKIEFFYGLKAREQILEVYKFLNTDKYFVYYAARGLFLFCDMALLQDVDHDTALSRKAKIILELKDKNDRLESSASATKTYLPDDIQQLLSDTLKKLSDINFLQHLTSFDVQANILKAMLNTDGL